MVFDLHSHEDQDNSNFFSSVHWDQSIHFATSGISSSDPGRFLYAAPGLQVRSVKCFFLSSFLLSFVCVWYVCMCVCMFTTAGVNIHVHMPVKVGSYCVSFSVALPLFYYTVSLAEPRTSECQLIWLASLLWVCLPLPP